MDIAYKSALIGGYLGYKGYQTYKSAKKYYKKYQKPIALAGKIATDTVLGKRKRMAPLPVTPRKTPKKSRSQSRGRKLSSSARSASDVSMRSRSRTRSTGSRSRSRSLSRARGVGGVPSNAGTMSKFKKGKPTSNALQKNGKYTKLGYMTKGVYAMTEVDNVFSSANAETLWIGHYNAPYDVFPRQLFRAMIKALMIKAGRSIPSFSEVMTSTTEGFVAGDIFRIQYYPSQTSTVLTNINYTIVAGDTYIVAADNLFNAWSTTASTTGNVPLNWRYAFLQFVPSAAATSKIPFTRINLQKTSFCIGLKSHLKVQNVTLAANATDNINAENVYNQPLTGKQYHVKGNSFLHVNTREEFTAKSVDGMIGFGALVNTPLSEPPPAGVFVNCKSHGGVGIEPGAIKISTLKDTYEWGFHKAMYITTCSLALGGTSTPVAIYQPRLGSSRLFALEKAVGNSTQDITVKWEHQFEIGVVVKYKEDTITEPIMRQ